MIDNQHPIIDADFEVLTGPESETESELESGGSESTPPAPMVVIEYRSRGLSATLGPPVLILIAALAILSYQRQRPIHPIVPLPAPVKIAAPKPPPEPLIIKVITSPAPSERIADLASSSDGSAHQDRPDDAGVPSRPGPATAAVASPPQTEPEPEPEPTPVEVAVVARPAIGFVPPEERPPSEVLPEPEPDRPAPTKDEVMDDIRREADQKEAERQRMEAIMPRIDTLTLIEDIRKAQSRRAEFHNALREILASGSEETGKEIHNLCESYGRTARPEIERAVARALKTSHARLGRRAKVEMMRFLGLPEPKILDFLANEAHWGINSRGGPRDRDDVRVQAARLLLKMPVATPRVSPGSAANPVAGVAPAPVRGPNRWPQ